MSDWMKENTVSDIQTAIQSSTIQTALERNVSDLSPQALQSFLTQAPIPRLYYTGDISSHTSGSNVTATWATASSHDPYSMMVPSTGIITIPIDGYYNGLFFMSATSAAGSAVDVGWMDDTKSIFYSHHVVGFDPASTTVYFAVVGLLAPFKAGTKILINLGNSTGGTLVFSASSIALTWVAPFNNYQGGQN